MARYKLAFSDISQLADAIREKNILLFSKKMTFPWECIENLNCDFNFKQLMQGTFSNNIYDVSFFSFIPSYLFCYTPIKECTALNCTQVEEGAFYHCELLSKINLPNCINVGNSAFECCYKLEDISLPYCINISSYGFAACSNLTEVSFPDCQTIANYAFNGCIQLSQITLPNCSYIKDDAFGGCFNLMSFYLLNSSVVSISEYTFYMTGIDTSQQGNYASIYVPVSLLTQYQSASRWTSYSERLVGI